jgi:hypothetical protein
MKANLQKVWVHCYRGGKRIASYDFGIEIPLDPRGAKPPSQPDFEKMAKDNLTSLGLARPPYMGISFKVEYE